MKPVCDHPSYCKNDKSAVYIGQTGHLAYKPHRNNNNYSPAGLASVRDQWNGLCSYTGNARGNYALCNIPINTHSWRHPGQANPGFICARGASFTAVIGSKNGAVGREYEFEIGYLISRSGKYSDRMIQSCGKFSMKPVCDHPNYCKNDGKSVYLGQSGHLAYKPHRYNDNYSPPGLSDIRDKWTGLCSYTANANGNYALCNIPTNTHSWRHPGQVNPGFMCAKPHSFTFKQYKLAITSLKNRGGKYSDRMIEQCKAIGMKPVCDHPSYCQNDVKSVFIGQRHHLAYRPHRVNNNYMPSGFSAIRDKWNGLCSYTANANRNYALCNIPINTHAWRTPGQYNPGFVCGKEVPSIFVATLQGKNGVKTAKYEFRKATLSARSGKYSTRMIEACNKVGLKPVCDHRGYCRNDKNSLYIGQTRHIAYKPHRNNNNYMPGGFAAIADMWDGLCSYTGNANRNYALCNIPINTHSWRHPGQANPGFICGSVYGKKVKCAATQVANSNFAKKGSIKGEGGSKVVVKCNSGYKGGGTVICGANGKFNTVKCTKVPPPPPPPPPPSKKCPGDIDGNKKVNIEDLLILLAQYGKTGTAKADLDGNKKVNIEDLLILLAKYGNKC